MPRPASACSAPPTAATSPASETTPLRPPRRRAGAWRPPSRTGIRHSGERRNPSLPLRRKRRREGETAPGIVQPPSWSAFPLPHPEVLRGTRSLEGPHAAVPGHPAQRQCVLRGSGSALAPQDEEVGDRHQGPGIPRSAERLVCAGVTAMWVGRGHTLRTSSSHGPVDIRPARSPRRKCLVPGDWLDGIGVDRGIACVRERLASWN